MINDNFSEDSDDSSDDSSEIDVRFRPSAAATSSQMALVGNRNGKSSLNDSNCLTNNHNANNSTNNNLNLNNTNNTYDERDNTPR